MFNIRNILVPTDFSDISYSAFGYARTLAEQFNADIHLVYVLEKTAPYLAIRSLDVSEDEITESMEHEADNTLKRAAEALRGDSSGINVVPVLKKGTDYEEIINYAAQISADLIVMCTHGRTGVLLTLMGSVAEKVMRHAKIPLLVIPPPEQTS